MNWDVKVRSLDCRIPENRTHIEVEVIETLGEGLQRVRERLNLTISGKIRELGEAADEAARAKVAENAQALGLEE